MHIAQYGLISLINRYFIVTGGTVLEDLQSYDKS